jgi:hypothetical protein
MNTQQLLDLENLSQDRAKIELVEAIQKHFPVEIIPAMIENLDFLIQLKFLRGMRAAYQSTCK